MKCDKCGYDDNGTGDFAHVCRSVRLKNDVDDVVKVAKYTEVTPGRLDGGLIALIPSKENHCDHRI